MKKNRMIGEKMYGISAIIGFCMIPILGLLNILNWTSMRIMIGGIILIFIFGVYLDSREVKNEKSKSKN